MTGAKTAWLGRMGQAKYMMGRGRTPLGEGRRTEDVGAKQSSPEEQIRGGGAINAVRFRIAQLFDTCENRLATANAVTFGILIAVTMTGRDDRHDKRQRHKKDD
jgi:hypothetical protein